jgi:hypothetical protein
MQLIIARVAKSMAAECFQRIRACRSMIGAAPILTGLLLLQGCITSQFPLLDDKSTIVDSSLTGSYIVVASDNKPLHYSVYLHRQKYFLLLDGKLWMIGTLHNWTAGMYLAQARPPVQTDQAGSTISSPYLYFLVRKTDGGAELNDIPCSTECLATNLPDLSNLIAAAMQDFHGKGFATAKTIDEGSH